MRRDHAAVDAQTARCAPQMNWRSAFEQAKLKRIKQITPPHSTVPRTKLRANRTTGRRKATQNERIARTPSPRLAQIVRVYWKDGICNKTLPFTDATTVNEYVRILTKKFTYYISQVCSYPIVPPLWHTTPHGFRAFSPADHRTRRRPTPRNTGFTRTRRTGAP